MVTNKTELLHIAPKVNLRLPTSLSQQIAPKVNLEQIEGIVIDVHSQYIVLCLA